ncbi:MAG: excinuclease ABC subunit UvrC [Deltaproteobacteria bacterium]|nr:excinuclease ABC subunit UvrC [Deltaproteobacteria bacterium]
MTDYLKQKIKHAPRTPGVYMMKDEEGTVIYIGKARDIRSRIRSYFGGTDSRFMVPFLVSRVCDIDFIVTETEKEALILENNLIKEHRPKYNVDFRDDKAYFHIRMDLREPFPRFQLVRRPKKDGAKYFGPYPSSSSAKETLRFLQPIFPLRTCRKQELNSRKRPCLEYEIGRCSAPCCHLIDAAAYEGLARDAAAFLEGRTKRLLVDLRDRMKNAADQMNYEAAAVLRDRIVSIEHTLEKQRMASMDARDQDVYGVYREDDMTQICAVLIRGGNIVGQKIFPLIRIGGETAEIVSALVKRYYDADAYIPAEILTPVAMEDGAVIAEWLTEKKGRAVSVLTRQKGKGAAILDMAQRNAENIFRTERLARDNPEKTIRILAEKLHLKNLPVRIECFDISNIGGRQAVGSMVTFESGLPLKARYRRFRIKTIDGADDYGMMYEVLKRRYLKKDDLPDLLMVDGGKGQLGVAVSVLKDLAVDNIDVIAIAKEKRDERDDVLKKGPFQVKKDYDRIYLPGRKDPVNLSHWPATLFLLQRIRDEAHRFAISYHRKLKEKQDLQSLLDEIPGIGGVRKKALLKYFGDAAHIREAPQETLQKVEGIGKATAAQIYDYLRKQ